MAPAMNTNMLEHDAVRRNMRRSPRAACGSSIPARAISPAAGSARAGSPSPRTIVEAAERMLAAVGLAARPARGRDRRADLRRHRRRALHRQPVERQDGIRGRRRGGAPRRAGRAGLRPVALPPPAGVEMVRVRSAERDARRRAAARRRGRHRRHGRRRRRLHAGAAGARQDRKDRRARWSSTLVRTPDILARARRARGGAAGPVLVGFAAESGDPVARGRAEAARKGVDLIVANDISAEGCRLRLRAQRRDDHQPRRRRKRSRSARRPRSPRVILDRAERLLSTARRPDLTVDPRALAEHLRFYQELGVTGISRDASWRRRDGCRTPRRRRSSRAPCRLRLPASVGRLPRRTASRAPPASRVDVLALARKRSPRSATDIGDCTRCKLHTQGASRSCSASATRPPT